MIPISGSERLPLCFNCFSLTLALVGSTTRVIQNDFIGLWAIMPLFCPPCFHRIHHPSKFVLGMFVIYIGIGCHSKGKLGTWTTKCLIPSIMKQQASVAHMRWKVAVLYNDERSRSRCGQL